MGKYLVTGAAGFIGSNVAKALLDRDHEVVVVDNLLTGYRSNVPHGATFIEAACQDEALPEMLDGARFDAILHIAGQSSGEISFDDPVYDLRTNTESTLNLIRYGLATGCRRFVYTSTMSVYKSLETAPNDEASGIMPLSFYGVGKLASEHYLRIYQGHEGVQPTIVRLFNIYGPGQNLANLRQGMASIYLAQILNEGKILVKGSLERFRDFVYISDVVDAYLRCLDDNRTIGKTFNVATGVRTTIRELLDLMMEVYGREVPVTVSGGTPGDTFGIWGDGREFERVAGFRPKISLREGLARMFDWAERSLAASE